MEWLVTIAAGNAVSGWSARFRFLAVVLYIIQQVRAAEQCVEGFLLLAGFTPTRLFVDQCRGDSQTGNQTDRTPQGIGMGRCMFGRNLQTGDHGAVRSGRVDQHLGIGALKGTGPISHGCVVTLCAVSDYG